jgi:hypothetical protein
MESPVGWIPDRTRCLLVVTRVNPCIRRLPRSGAPHRQEAQATGVLSVGPGLGATLPEEVAAPEGVADADPVAEAVTLGDGDWLAGPLLVGLAVAVGAIVQVPVGESDAVGSLDTVVPDAVGLADTGDCEGWEVSDGTAL